jgi:hypothetical protein
LEGRISARNLATQESQEKALDREEGWKLTAKSRVYGENSKIVEIGIVDL